MAQYDIFISFSEADSTEVNSLIDRLGHGIPGIRIFHENDGDELSEFERSKTIEAIDDSRLVIFAFSENSLTDENCEKEVMYAKNTGKRVVPYLLPGMTLKGWLLYELGRINCINSANDQEVDRFIQTLRQRLGFDAENRITEEDNVLQSNSNSVSDSLAPSETQQTASSTLEINNIPSATRPNTLETELVFDPNIGEFVSRVVEANRPTDYASVFDHTDPALASSSLSSSSSFSEPKLYINGHEYVDLGLPSGIKWAACNVGAYKPEQQGTFFAWGEVTPKNIYTQANSITFEKDFHWLLENGYLQEFGKLSLTFDAARKNWGSTWRMPTAEEIRKLEQYTTKSWNRVNGVDGCELKSTVNGKSIFFPAFGKEENGRRKDKGNMGMFWSSTVSDNDKQAFRLAVGVNLFSVRGTDRYIGLNIRPVSD